MTRSFLIVLILAIPPLAACVPPEYRAQADLSGGSPIDAPIILPLDGFFGTADADIANTLDAQDALIQRNASLTDRADRLRDPQTATAPETDPLQTDEDPAETLQDRAAAIRARQ